MKKRLRNGILVLLSILLFSGYVSYAEESRKPDAVVFGDVDGDGELTAQDASCISRHLTQFRLLNAAEQTRADIDGDGAITERDSSQILSALMSAEFYVPVTQSFSMLVTSDLDGFAWDPVAPENGGAVTAMNVAACATALREKDPDLLLFDAGGSLLGSSISDDYADKTERMYGPITSLFVKMRYDAVLLGDEAMSYPSQNVRREVNELIFRKIPVLGANLQKADPTVFDKSGVLWNDLVPYVILEVPQGEEKPPMRIAVIGMTEPDLCPSDDEVKPVDPIEIYAKLRKELKNQADYTVLLYHGNTESDALQQGSYSLRDFLKKTDSIDIVLAAHGGSDTVRSERNAAGNEIPIVSLHAGTDAITKVSVSLREKGRPAVLIEKIETKNSVPDDTIQKAVRPYINAFSGMMDAVVCTLTERIDPYEPNALGTTDGMEILHEMQIFAAERWIDENDVDLPHTILSIAYPYMSVGGLREGAVRYRELCAFDTEIPRYSLLLVRGSELRAWLSAYAKTVMSDKTVYSLYGLSYLINTLNPETPVGFLEHSSGLRVEDDEVFTLILAEKDEDSVIRPYLDEEWLPYEDRVIEGITLPTPENLTTLNEDPIVDALAAYLESVGTLTLKHLYSWIVI